ncbi:hypothetical protein [Actinoplanes teichomyceticus]|uniref:hypothetical protein n=1 Tax=Actinoplanes teichomyceticus TaxID=1867 RepID=UPI0016568719|nr:hypothetical protein [Actinoplanes teichomyceticus]
MTTFRLLRQTSRCSRFAQVTVDLDPVGGPGVEVAATVAVEFRREADLGARWALRGVSTATKVIVTAVVATEIDTGTADVYEATAHAVWQALGVQHSVPYVGFSDPQMVASWLTEMIGRRLDAVIEARHWYQGRRESDAESLLHAWLYFDHAMPVGLHHRGDELLLAKEDPYRSYDMDEHGETRVGPALSPDVLSKFVGARLIDGAVIVGHDGALVGAGLDLRFDTGSLVVGALGDEWVLATDAEPAALTSYWTRQPFLRGTTR